MRNNIVSTFDMSNTFFALDDRYIRRKKKQKPSKTKIMALHTADVPAVRAAGKTELSYRNETIILFSFATNKTKDNVEASLASLNC